MATRKELTEWINEINPNHNFNLELFSEEQLNWIYYGLEVGADIGIYANPSLSPVVMRKIIAAREILPRGVKLPPLLFKKLSNEQVTTVITIMATVEGEGGEFDFSLLNENQSPNEMIDIYATWRVNKPF